MVVESAYNKVNTVKKEKKNMWKCIRCEKENQDLAEQCENWGHGRNYGLYRSSCGQQT